MAREGGDSEGKRQKEYQSTVKTEKQSQGERENDRVRDSDRGQGEEGRAEGERDGGRQDYQAPPSALTPHSSQLRHYPLKAESPL